MSDQPALTKILVVDDEAGMREMLAMLLKKHGFECTCVNDGQQALDAVAQESFDVILTDVRMPKLDGIGLVKKLHEIRCPSVLVMMSAFVELETAIEGMKHGAHDYISKPFKSDEVLLKLKLALQRQKLEQERARLEQENRELRAKAHSYERPTSIIGQSPKMMKVFEVIGKVAPHKSTVLVLGESGTGKELVALELHKKSNRSDRPFIAVNCGAIPETLIESELFGHVKGAFTDASRDKVGLFEQAQDGTLFLDEIGELPPSMQVKLLRVLQEAEIRRVGGEKSVKVDVRVVAATARDLIQMVDDGSFREDLFYRLNVLMIQIPPLRERRDDIPLLVRHFCKKHGESSGRPGVHLDKDALIALGKYGWPGNIRELENTIERALVLAESDIIGVSDLPTKIAEAKPTATWEIAEGELSIKRASRYIEEKLIKQALEKTGGNRTHAAELLEISHRTLLYKIKEYGLA